MASTDIAESLRHAVRERASGRCEYCLTSEALSGIRCQIDHITPLSRQGPTTADNLCLACVACNGYKGTRTHFLDPETGEEVPLFNPRRHVWREHFQWSDNGVEIAELTPCGRATVVALKLNNESLTRARRRWVLAGWHPPTR
jgi:hypothetical protein